MTIADKNIEFLKKAEQKQSQGAGEDLEDCFAIAWKKRPLLGRVKCFLRRLIGAKEATPDTLYEAQLADAARAAEQSHDYVEKYGKSHPKRWFNEKMPRRKWGD